MVVIIGPQLPLLIITSMYSITFKFNNEKSTFAKKVVWLYIRFGVKAGFFLEAMNSWSFNSEKPELILTSLE